ncbi:MAG: CDP-alcohol phosphatidyltransferase family protein [Nocardioides sp.]
MDPIAPVLLSVLAAAPLLLALLGLSRRRSRVVTPADGVTLLRAGLAGGCLALVSLAAAGSLPPRNWPLVLVAVPMLALDAVDGWVARQTSTGSHEGGVFDAEVDAGIALILAVAASLVVGWWALSIGLARYLYGGLSLAWPWLGRDVGRNEFRRTVGGLQGAALLLPCVPVVDPAVGALAVAGALALLAASFVHQALACRRSAREVSAPLTMSGSRADAPR